MQTRREMSLEETEALYEFSREEESGLTFGFTVQEFICIYYFNEFLNKLLLYKDAG